MSNTSKRIVPLSPEKRHLLDMLMKREQVTIPQKRAIPRRSETDVLVPSFAQERLWFLSQLAPENVAYNVPLSLRLSGQLDTYALKQSINEILRRHQSLRTIFVEAKGHPSPVIVLTENIQLPIIDLEYLSPAQRESSVTSIVNREACQPFDLLHGPLVCMALVRLSRQEHLLFLTMHHIVSDGWSIEVLVRELAVLYPAFLAGNPSPLPELPIQYADFALWQRQWLQGEVLENQLAYWKKTLAGTPALLELPTDHRRVSIQTFQGARHSFYLSQNLADALKAFSQREGVTLFMTLLAAFQTLLSRYSRQEDISVGTPIANRTWPEVAGLIGFFANTLVLRTDLSGNPSFRELLTRVREVALGAYAHQDLPFEKLVEVLQPERNINATPLFQVAFALQNASIESLELTEDLRLSLQPVYNGTAKFDITLGLVDTSTGLKGVLEYNTDLFEESTIRRMALHYQSLLEEVVVNPDQRLSDLPLLTHSERQQLLVEWNDTHVAYPQQYCLHRRIEMQVECRPDATALVWEDQQLTYRELNERANALAHYLQARGVAPEVVIGVYAERTPEMVVALLGILKAGGAYLPLDPAYPRERVHFMLTDARVPVVLTQQRLVAQLQGCEATIMCLDTDWETIAQTHRNNPINSVQPDNLAYVIYTSGSTGQPKGVQISQRGLLNLVNWHLHAFDISASDRTTHLAGLGFDAATWELWPYLAAGASIHLLDEQTRLSPSHLRNYLLSKAITISFLPTPLAEQMLELEWPTSLSLRTMLTGGDKLHTYPSLSLPFTLVNNYGPTENTVVATSGPVPPTSEEQVEQTPSIGRPIANVEVYVLDRHLHPVPIGVPGELYLGGIGLARGYMNQPALTAERFIPHPFSTSPGARLYKTGDTVCYLSDGTLDFLGRHDMQVKVRGFRVELGEIKAVLGQHPAVREAAVIALEERPGNKRLVAYIVPFEQHSVPTSPELRRFLQMKLPAYMIPSAFIVLENLPLTANGKLDRQALPQPQEFYNDLDSHYEAPRNSIEEVLVDIWCDCLSLKRRIGIHENFFEIGGHSLLATQLISRVRDTFQVELLLRHLFETPTVAEIAECISSAYGVDQNLEMPKIEPSAERKVAPLSFAQQRLWFLDQWEPANVIYNVPMALRMIGRLNRHALEQSINEIVCRHATLRTHFTVVEGQPVQVIASLMSVQLSSVYLEALPEPEREMEMLRIANAAVQLPFDLEHGPLIRASLVQLNGEEHVLLLAIHHIVFDGWSMSVFVRELAELYTAFSTSRSSNLLELPVQYTDFAVWQRQWLQGEVLQKQLAYWKARLKDAPTLLELPTNRPRPALQTYRGALHSFLLPSRLTQGLKALSKREGVTLFMMLLAIFQTQLYRYTGQDDLVVGAPIANRTLREIEHLIGFFANTALLRADLSGNPSFSTLLRRVRAVALEAYIHQDVPFEQLVEALQPERSLSHSPLFQVMFALQNTSLLPLDLPGLHLSAVEVHSGTAKFDLSLLMVETETGLKGGFEYNTDLFDKCTIERMAGHFQVLLEAIVANPEQRLSDLPLLTSAEQRQLLIEWNASAVEYPGHALFHELFEAQAKRTPDAIAVIFEHRRLTYRELNELANRLAHVLQALGVGPEVLVALLEQRGIDLLTAMLAVFKAGGAYLPLDPYHPARRLYQVLEHSACRLVLTAPEFTAILAEAISDMPPAARPQILSIENLLEQGQATENLQACTMPHNLAYIIYTSGSTGIPKGVMVEQKGMLNHLYAKIRALELTPVDRVAQTASQCFDISVWQFLAALLIGGSVSIIKDEAAHDPVQLLTQVEQEEISILETVPSLLRVMLEAIEQGSVACPDLAKLRWLVPTGEALPPDFCLRWFELYPGIPLLNAYGPTECSDDVTHFPIYQPLASTVVHTPIGRSVDNMRMYVLDSRLSPVPIGVSGELYVGGVGVGRGYLKDPLRTAETFLPHPFSAEPGARLYRTGDLARYMPDGNLEFLGRVDYQVKIRGYRIELGEIEVTLNQHPLVREVVVVVREDVPGEKRLVAYIVADQEQPPSSSDLRSYLKEKLPEYMLPAVFVLLESLPLSFNGKVNRKALPAPDESATGLAEPLHVQESPIEEVLVGIWADVLGLKRVGIHDNFFEVGGHSLLATQVIARVRKIFGLEMPLRSIFEAPTVASLAERIEAAPSLRQALPVPPMLPASHDGPQPLSFGQQRLWFLAQMEPDSITYNVPIGIQLTGHLDVAALRRSLAEIVRRHNILRTSFSLYDGEPIQVIMPPSSLPLVEVNLADLPETAREIEKQRWIRDNVRQPFDLSQGPLLRATLVEESETQYLLVLTLHHIISDGWSQGVFVRELAALYEAYSTGKPPRLPELSLQYSDYATWQRQWLPGGMLKAQLAYWKQRLDGAPAMLTLPTDYPRPAVQTSRGAWHYFSMPTSLTESLHLLSRREGVTLFMTLLAAFQLLLSRYSQQNDILIGTPIANRTHAEIEDLIGFFANTLVLRTRLTDSISFRALLAEVREGTLGAYAHQDLPFEKLVEVLQPERDLSHTPLFQVMFAFQNAAVFPRKLGALDIRTLSIESGVAQFDITLLMVEGEQGLKGALEYNIDLFEAATIERMTEHFQTLLESIVSHPEQRLIDIPMLTQAKRRQLLFEWNETSVTYPEHHCLHQLFEQQVRCTPEATAVVYGREQLTYAELNSRANQLAHYLRKLDVGPEIHVGLCLERSLNAVVSMLAVLKAGGVYVPLDPTYPKERLTFMLEETRTAVVLTQAYFAENLEIPFIAPQANIMCLDIEEQAIAKESVEDIHSGVMPANVAYVIYTSGSTGRPKGVVVQHAALVNHSIATMRHYALIPGDRVLQFASLSFDVAAEELYPTLLSGATVVLRLGEVAPSFREFQQMVETAGLTVLNLPAPYWHEWVAELARSGMRAASTLRLVIVGSDAVSVAAWKTWKQLAGDRIRSCNAYGVTEAAITSTIYESTANGIASGTGFVPIGRPIANTQVYLLDAQLQPVPPGVPGELYIGGRGLALGYCKRPDLTAEQFIPHPFSNQPGERLYKTGDLARYLPTGDIEFLGRVDAQVKMRGFRLEPGEIETVLRQHPHILDALVITRAESHRDMRLVAYLVPGRGKTPADSTPLNIQDVRSFLQERLPHYMIPSHFVLLDALPLLPNGKVDRHALAVLDASPAALEQADAAPQTDSEQLIAAVWQEVLQIENIGRHENFFDLGGHSLLLIRVHSKLCEIFKKDFPMIDMFKYPTIASLAAYMAHGQDKPLAARQGHARAATRKELMERQREFRRQTIRKEKRSQDV